MSSTRGSAPGRAVPFSYDDAVATVLACTDEELRKALGRDLSAHCEACAGYGTPPIAARMLFAAAEHLDWLRWRRDPELVEAVAATVGGQFAAGHIVALPLPVALRLVDDRRLGPVLVPPPADEWRGQGHRLVMLHHQLPRPCVDSDLAYLALCLRAGVPQPPAPGRHRAGVCDHQLQGCPLGGVGVSPVHRTMMLERLLSFRLFSCGPLKKK